MTLRIFTIDASGKKIGRVASEAALHLIGKNRVDFAKNRVPAVQVTIKNASAMSIPVKKAEGKEYVRFSGYPSGLFHETFSHVVAKKGHAEILRRAIFGMLPGNKLRKERMKHLIVTE